MEDEAPDEQDEAPSSVGRWVGLVLGALITPVALFAAMWSGAMGHGDYVGAKLLYPIPMLLTFNSVIGPVQIALAVVQYPVYGFVYGSHGAQRDRLLRWIVGAHIVCTLLDFVVLPNFS